MNEAFLNNLLLKEIPLWSLFANPYPNDPLFSLRRTKNRQVGVLKVLQARNMREYTKSLANACGLDGNFFTPTSWKVGSVSYGVAVGENQHTIKTRADHVTWAASLHYQTGSVFSGSPPKFGLSESAALWEISRFHTAQLAVASAGRRTQGSRGTRQPVRKSPRVSRLAEVNR